MKRTSVLLVMAGGLACAAIGAFSIAARTSRRAANQAEGARPAAIVSARRQPLTQGITLSGEFKPFQEVDVHAKVAGYIRHIYVDVGSRVREGETLAVLEVPELRAQVTGADAATRRAQDDIHVRESEVARAQSTHSAMHFAYSRLQQVAQQRPGLIAQQELDDAAAKDQESEAQVAVARAALSAAQNALGVAQASQQQVTALSSYTRIIAPFDGVVTRRYADTGALVQAGTTSNTQAMPVVRVAETKKLRLLLPVPESAVPEIRLDSPVDVAVPALHRTFQGKVARLADALDQQTRTMDTEVDVRNADGSLIGGMYAEVRLVLHNRSSALSLPVQAVSRNGTETTVLLVDPTDRLEERRVTLGMEDSDRVEVLSGLSENDRVVIGSHSNFRPGERVAPQPLQAAGTTGEGQF